MFTHNDKKHNQFLEINIELKSGVSRSKKLTAELERIIFEGLKSASTEYQYLAETLKDRVKPKVICWPYENPVHFKVGIKQKWIKKI